MNRRRAGPVAPPTRRPDFQSDDPVDVFAPGREKDDGDRGALPERAQDLEAVLLGQHHVENDEIVAARGGAIDRTGAGVMRLHLETLAAEQLAHEIAQLPVVVDHEDRPRHTRSNCHRKGA
jgi:hypothetical protein